MLFKAFVHLERQVRISPRAGEAQAVRRPRWIESSFRNGFSLSVIAGRLPSPGALCNFTRSVDEGLVLAVALADEAVA